MNRTQTVAIIGVLVVVIAGMGGLLVVKNADGGEPDRIGIICAMDSEAENFNKNMSVDRTVTVADMKYNIGTISGHDVVVVKSGMGKVNAAACAQTLISQFNVKAIINSGVAGGLDPALGIGDFVISSDVVQHDFDLSPIMNILPGLVPPNDKVAFDADKNLIESAKKSIESTKSESFPDSKVVVGRVCSGDQFINSQAQKDAITSVFGGKCCEMEGGAIAQVCYLSNTPFVIIRGISDGASGEDFTKYQEAVARVTADAVLRMIEDL